MSDCHCPHPEAHMNESTKVLLAVAGRRLFPNQTAVEEQIGRLRVDVINQARLIELVHEEICDRDEVHPVEVKGELQQGACGHPAKLSSLFPEDRSPTAEM